MENTIHQVYNFQVSQPVENRASINLLEGIDIGKIGSAASPKPFSLKLAKILAIIGLVILAVYFVPGAVEFARTKLSKSEVENLTAANQNTQGRSLPAFNPALSKTNRLVVPSIGVDTDITEATYDNYETALKKGVWRVSDFGQPDKTGAPIILAAHRFGYIAWSNSYRHYNSFYNLPKVKVGDTVNMVWRQRQYTYGVYKTENATAISDYSADLILYTCESLSGEERIFVYAKLLS